MKTLIAAALATLVLAPAAFADEPVTRMEPYPAPISEPYVGPYAMLPPPTGFGVLGSGPLVNNIVTVGVQANVQNGEGNVGINTLEVGQAAGALGPASLVNNATAVGAQINAQNGFGNFALNQAAIGQSAFAGGFLRGPVLED